MKITIVKPGFEPITRLDTFAVEQMLILIEKSGRVCYKSEDKITSTSAKNFIRAIVKSGHESVIEHGVVSIKFIGDRSMSHQLVRHRIAAFSQESQRYCDYGKLGFQVICPPTIADFELGTYEDTSTTAWTHTSASVGIGPGNIGYEWMTQIADAYRCYLELRERGVPPEDARSVLPNATKTEVVTTFNMRQWRHVFDERALNPHAQWQIREIMQEILVYLSGLFPCIFQDQMDRLAAMRLSKK